ncbi:MAG: hypothetical protein QM270_01305 [Bacillota bacterium]|nr:hypothetical protein [Bacillota bacterium]
MSGSGFGDRRRSDSSAMRRSPAVFRACQELPDVDSLPYKRPKRANLESLARRLRRQLPAAGDEDAAVAAVEKFDRRLAGFAENVSLTAYLYALEPGDQAIAQQHAELADSEAWLNECLRDTMQPLLTYKNKPELATKLGNMIFLRAQNFHFFHPDHLREDREEEAALCAAWERLREPGADGDEEAGKADGDPERRERQRDIYRQLTRLRHSQARQQGFHHYRALALGRLSAWGYDGVELAYAHLLIARWLVPLALRLRIDRQSFLYPPGEDDEKSRAAVAAMPPEPLPLTALADPAVWLEPTVELSEACRHDLLATLDLVLAALPAPLHQTWRELRRGGYVRVLPSASESGPQLLPLPLTRAAILLLEAPEEAADLPAILDLIGAQLAYVGIADEAALVLERHWTIDTRVTLEQTLRHLLLPHAGPLLARGEADAVKLTRASVTAVLHEVLLHARRDRFESSLAAATRSEEEAGAAGGALWSLDPDAAWSGLTDELFPRLNGEGIEPFDPSDWLEDSFFFSDSFRATPLLAAQLAALAALEHSLSDRGEGISQAWMNLAASGQTAHFRELLGRSGLYDPFAEATLKRLAYRLAYWFGY